MNWKRSNRDNHLGPALAVQHSPYPEAWWPFNTWWPYGSWLLRGLWHRVGWLWDIPNGWLMRNPAPAASNGDWRALERQLLKSAPERRIFAAPGYGTC